MVKSNPSIVVVGAGIIGVSTSLYLSHRGANVTLVDGGRKDATCASFGWINAHTPANQHYFQMRMKSMTLWRELLSTYSRLPLRFDGGLDWDFAENELDPAFLQYQALGYNCEMVGGDQLAKLAPQMVNLPARAIHCKDEGVVEPKDISDALLKLAEERGVVYQGETQISSIGVAGDRVCNVRTNDQKFSCDFLVICAGAGSASLLETLGVALPMKSSYGVLMRTSAVDIGTNKVFSTPGLHFRQLDDGSLLVGGDQAGGGLDQDNLDASQKLLSRLVAMMPHTNHAEIVAQIRGKRPIPVDNQPIVGGVNGIENLFVGVTHSGVTMAPLIGERLAKQIINGEVSDDMDPFKVSRFATGLEKDNADISGQIAGGNDGVL